MRELSLHILDIVQNSIAAGANEISILIEENNLFIIKIKDNGCGMTKGQLENVSDPFYTTRKTRNVGLGLAFFKKTAEMCDGKLKIDSKKGRGTIIRVELVHNHVNRPPLGNMAETIQILVMGNPEIDFRYTHKLNGKKFEFASRQYRDELFSGGKINYEIFAKIKNDVSSGLQQIQILN